MRLSRLFRRDDGAAMVEMAFVLPIFLLVVWGIIDFGRLLFTTNSMATAVREGARVAAVMASPTDPASVATVKARVENAFTPLGGPAITDAEISVDLVAVPGSVVVKVTNYPWPAVTPVSAVIGQQLNITRQATFRLERTAN
jgi:Flp pilus assembly protein TadG